jgi:uncharacterized membrane protein
MAKDLGDALGTAIGKVARETAHTVAANSRKGADGRLSGMRGVAAGAGLAALAPFAVKGAGSLVKRGVGTGAAPVKKAGEKIGGGVKDAVGSAGGGVKDVVGKGLPGGGSKASSKGLPGVGKGRRMPIQQAVDVAVPIKVAYNQWTQFEDWPRFMHRLERVTQKDPCHVTFKAKIWGISREFDAEIVEQRPDERIKWRVTNGVDHTGVVTFHELADRLTRIEVNIDVHPDSLIEKAGRGLRHAKRAVRADLSRFKAYVEMEEHETGAWRGVIDDAKVKSSQRKRASASRSTSNGRAKSASRSTASRSSTSKSTSNGRAKSASRSTASKSNGKASSSRKSSSSRKTSGSRS